ncbi:hypothetical protein K439DRAFT_1635427 [Ramaria rubella]|nr:hypothetical protein K439DRAFT_1635427 [Ramaria rubella]
MKRGDFSRRQPNDWPSRDRGPPRSPKDTSYRRGGDSKDESTKPAWSVEQKRGEASSKQSSGWGDASRTGGWGEPSSRPSSGWGEPITHQSSPWGEHGIKESISWREPRIPAADPSLSTSKPPPPLAPPPVLPPPPSQHPTTMAVMTESTPVMPPSSKPTARWRSLPEKSKDTVVIKAPGTSSSNTRRQQRDRITLLSEAIMLRIEYTQVARSLEARRKMQTTSRYSHVSENVQSKLDGFVQECEDKGKELKSKMEGILNKLIDADTPPSESNDDKLVALDQTVPSQFADFAFRLNELEVAIKKIELEGSQRASPLPGKSDDKVGDEPKGSNLPSSGHSDNTIELLKRMEQLEVQVTDLENQNRQETANIIEVVDTRLEEKMDSIRSGGYTHEDVLMADETLGTGFHSHEGLISIDTNLRAQLDKFSHDHDEFAEETANLITKHAEFALELRQLRETNAALRMNVSENQSIIRDMQIEADRNNHQIRALVAAVKVIRAEAPPPFDMRVLEPMRKQILQDVLAGVNTSLNSFREQCEAAMVSAREETLKQVSTYFGRTVDLVNILYGYFSRSWRVEDGVPST